LKGHSSKHFKSEVPTMTLLKQLVFVEIIITRVAHMGNKSLLYRCW